MGAASRMWEAQKKIPSATWLGNMMDWLMGWGKYHLETEPKDGGSSEAGQKRMISFAVCPQFDSTYGRIIHNYTNTSYEALISPNGGCAPLDPVPYWTEIFQIIWRDISGADDVICRIGDCIKTHLSACYPNCLPCQNATDAEKNMTLDDVGSVLPIDSDFDKDLAWVYIVQTKYYPNHTRALLNAWKLNQTYNLFNSVRQNCENSILYPPNLPSNQANPALYSLLIIPVALVAGGAIFVVYKRHKPSEHTPILT